MSYYLDDSEDTVTVKIDCCWCGEMNELTGEPVYCSSCQHRGDVPRKDCDCPKCRKSQ